MHDSIWIGIYYLPFCDNPVVRLEPPDQSPAASEIMIGVEFISYHDLFSFGNVHRGIIYYLYTLIHYTHLFAVCSYMISWALMIFFSSHSCGTILIKTGLS
jgi:hypothetical protein